MIGLGRPDALAIGAAALVAAITPLALLLPDAGRAPAPRPAAPPLEAAPPPPLAAAFRRPLFAEVAAEVTPAPADAPALVGIVGRIDRDAVAMVRGADGTTRTLRPGESVDGWQLQSLAIDAAFFTRGSERVRVALPAGE